MSEIDFLTPGIQQIRHQIRGIIDSYSHDWDVIAELCQNAIDAIRKKSPSKGHISIEVNCFSHSITVRDNGCGINKSSMPTLLAPFSTSKFDDARAIGEKGVGITFVIFSSDEFHIESREQGAPDGLACTISRARDWIESKSNDPLMLRKEDKSEIDAGTLVTVHLRSDHPIFSLSMIELEFMLRTRTAIGDTAHIWGSALDADCQLIRHDVSGAREEKEFECRYWLPIDGIPKNDLIDLDEYRQWRSEADRSDADKRRKLHGKIIYYAGRKNQSGRQLNYWSCFVPQRGVWERMSSAIGLTSEAADGSDESGNSLVFSSGLETSTKGMPTGIRLELRPRGSAGYVPNFFMIVEDPSLRFDIGRKAIQGRQQGVLKDLAYDQFREYLNNVRQYMGGGLEEPPQQWERDEVFATIGELPDLEMPHCSFLKRPNAQEATVAGIFFDLMGRGIIRDLRPLISGYKGRYDLYAKWARRNVVIEFKYDLTGLLKDFSEEKKLFDEVNCVVLWEITESDRLLAKRRGIAVLDVSGSFPNATMQLTIPNVNPLYVIELRKVLEESRNG